MTTKKARLLKATGRVAKNLAIVTVSTVVGGMLTLKSKEAVREIGDGSKQVYNIIVNTFQKL